MALPLGPVIGLAIRYGAVAAAGALVARAMTTKKEQKNAAFEASFDQVGDGFEFYRTEAQGETQFHAHHGDWRRVWLGKYGVEVDSRVLGRLRIRKLVRK